MALKDILAISGHSGLFKFISQGRQGIIVESLADGKRTNVPTTAKVSGLADIAIYAETGEVPLREVLLKVKNICNAGPAIDPKSDNNKLKDFFASVLPDYDRERVYVSDIKKVVLWYNQIQALNMLEMLEEEEEAGNDSSAE
ncbi:MAG TPA: DUF5606 domain-containing protein [Tenuifilaceae bacterium]|nr:DUF5606 domain-containing protein [Tenuifilaceae bacterium]HQB77484.1 DUF5606 domain-containing protein [Tenuifilaceae bacterium]